MDRPTDKNRQTTTVTLHLRFAARINKHDSSYTQTVDTEYTCYTIILCSSELIYVSTCAVNIDYAICTQLIRAHIPHAHIAQSIVVYITYEFQINSGNAAYKLYVLGVPVTKSILCNRSII